MMDEEQKIAELERRIDELTEQERRREIAFANGRSLGAQRNKARAEHHRDYWLKEARRIRGKEPHLSLEDVAIKVRNASLTIDYTLNGKPYKVLTIYRFLAECARSGQIPEQSQAEAS